MTTGQIKGNMQSTPFITFMKTLLMVFNFIFWVTGVAVLALGVWMKLELYMYVELTTTYYWQSAYILMGIGGGIIIIGFLACLCTKNGTSVMLYAFSALLFLLFIGELGVGIAGFVYKGKIQAGFKEGMENAMTAYATDETKKEALNGMQETLECCGKETYEDWFVISWDGSTTSDKVPKSCCIDQDALSTCQNTHLKINGTTDIHTNGCYSKVTSFMEKNFAIIGGVAVGFAFLQLIGCLMACTLAKSINKNKYETVQ